MSDQEPVELLEVGLVLRPLSDELRIVGVVQDLEKDCCRPFLLECCEEFRVHGCGSFYFKPFLNSSAARLLASAKASNRRGRRGCGRSTFELVSVGGATSLTS